jgi:regulatory factor X 1/2/3
LFTILKVLQQPQQQLQQPQQQQQQQLQQPQQQPQQQLQQQQPVHPSTAIINGTELTEDELNRLFLNGSSHQLPNFGSINLEHFPLPANCTMDDVKKFEEIYKNQCEKILDLVVGLKLLDIENIWHMFWRSPHINHKFYEDQLSTPKFMALCECQEIIEFTKQSDFQFYQFCIEILIPDVLGTLPTTLVQSIRQLAKHLEGWLRNALVNVPENMKQSKMQIINTFSMTLRRYTSLNHLAQTVKNSLQNENILSQMLHDITKVDFSYIKVIIIQSTLCVWSLSSEC